MMLYPSDIEIQKELKERFETYNIIAELDDTDYTIEERAYIWLAEDVINFVAYDNDIDLKIGKKIYKTVEAIINRTQSEFMEEHYEDYIVCLNLIGEENLEWGTSIRYCWFDNTNQANKLINAYRLINKYKEKQNSIK